MRLIDANKLSEAFDEEGADVCADYGELANWGFSYRAVHDLIANAPTITIPVRYGNWEGYTSSKYYGRDEDNEPIYRDGVLYYCSECRRRSIIREKYCPACGARMDADENESR